MMQKKAAAFCLLGAMICGACPVSAAEGTQEISAVFRNIKVVVDGKELATDAEPFLYNGIMYLPVRAIGEAAGKEVLWDKNAKTITLQDVPLTIETDPEAEGDPDFILSVAPSGRKERMEILRVREKGQPDMPYSLYYYGLSDVSVTLDGQTLPLAQALEDGELTVSDILHKGYQDEQDGKITGWHFRDGGSAQYMYEEYTVIKFHEIAGRRDLYIGVPGMEIDMLHDQYEYHSPFQSVQEVLEHYIAFAETMPETERSSVFSEGLNYILSVANRANTPEEECAAAVYQLAEACGVELEG